MTSLNLCKKIPWKLGRNVIRHQTSLASAKGRSETFQPENETEISDTVPRKNLSKILIANRGEIACRIIRTARKMGISTVAVYSDPDKASLHVDMADEAFRIGPASTNESYLNETKIIEAALRSGAEAVHPGYGFLSQSPEFAKKCAENNVIFIGPSPRAISDMGIKSTSKTLMERAGVPIIRGYHGDDQRVERLKMEAMKIGFPVMIKAFRGGGGKGMRIALSEEEFEQQLESAKRESLKSFGDDAMLVEKYVQRPRHVEVQVFGDHHGNYVYLFERDCSVQRRHQKIIEEAPAPFLSEETRRSLGEAAVRAARAVDYVGAGTVEFIFDSQKNEFFFMEMNTRLQVEHPVTEMITKTDLVFWQIKIASGEKLPFLQKSIQKTGHSFEARIYAENPEENFLPGAGFLNHLSLDFDVNQFERTVRIESGVRQGDEVSVHYDPMIAKVVVWGEDRSSALRKLRSVLTGYHISGLATNVNFLISLCDNAAFQAGDVHTDFIKEHFNELFPEKIPPTAEALVQAAIALFFMKNSKNNFQKNNSEKNNSEKNNSEKNNSEKNNSEKNNSEKNNSEKSCFLDPFESEKNWRMNYNFTEIIKISSNGQIYDVTLTSLGEGKFRVSCLGQEMVVEGVASEQDDVLVTHVCIDGHTTKFKSVMEENKLHLFKQDGCVTFEVPALKYESLLTTKEGGADEAKAPMPGVIEKVLVECGQTVKAADPLVVMIAMKMEYVIKAPKAGVIKKIAFKAGDNVKKHAQLVYFEEVAS